VVRQRHGGDHGRTLCLLGGKHIQRLREARDLQVETRAILLEVDPPNRKEDEPAVKDCICAERRRSYVS
jgi:hypothetical protein